MAKTRSSLLVVMIFSSIAGFMTLWSTARYGAGLSPDSVGYIQLARDIKANGFDFIKEYKAVEQPPLYAAALIGMSALAGSDDYIRYSAWLNSVCAAALVAILLVTVAGITKSKAVLILVGLLSCFSRPLTYVWSMALAESLFILLFALAIFLATKERPTFCHVVLTVVVSVSAVYTRYAGAVLIPIISISYLVAQNGSLRRRVLHSISYALTTLLLLLPYLIRNHGLSGGLFGRRYASESGLVGNLSFFKDVILSWFLSLSVRESLLVQIVLGVSLLILAWRCRVPITQAVRDAAMPVKMWAAVGIVYVLFLVWTSATTAYDTINTRLLSPFYPAILVIVSFIMKPEAWKNQKLWRLVIGAGYLLYLAGYVPQTVLHVYQNSKNGIEGFNSSSWHASDTIAHFRANDLTRTEVIYSNVPGSLYILADVQAKLPPAKRHHKSTIATGITGDNVFDLYPDFDGALLVWFDAVHHLFLFDIDELRRMCVLEEIAEFEDGTMYRVSRPE